MKCLIAVLLALALALCPSLVSCGEDEAPVPAFPVPEGIEDAREAMKVVVHAAGRLRGVDESGVERDYDGSNSLEGLIRCAEAGARAVELDFNFTSDGKLACIHDWHPEYAAELEPGVAPTLDDFLTYRIYGQFTPLWIETVAAWLRENPGVWVVTDIKDRNIEGCRAIAEACPDLKDRFLVQIYREEEYAPIRELGFDYIVFTLYMLDWNSKTDWKSLGEFAGTHPLVGFTFSYELCSVDGYVEGMLSTGVPLYVHTINENFEEWYEKGFRGVYADRMEE